MPTATLIYSLPEEQEDFDLARSAGKMLCAIEDFGRELRSRWKHGDVQETTWEEVRELWFSCLQDNQVDL